ncbi:MAG: two-component regulator propeller domain-containing protein [Bacteroidota bacterium]
MKKQLLLSTLFCFLIATGFSQNWTNYNEVNSGLSNNEISSIAIDNNDIVWIAASSGCGGQYGLNRFDGTNWITYTTSNSGLVSNAVGRIITDQSNNVWITYYCGGLGLTKFDGTNWTTYTTANSNLPSNLINDLFVDASNNLWLTSNGITKFTGTSFINYMPNPSVDFPLITLLVANGFVYATGGTAGLYKYNISNNSVTHYTTTNSNIPAMNFSTLAMDQNGKLWIGSQFGFSTVGSSGGGIVTFDGSTFTGINPFSSPYSWVYYNQSIAADQSNNIWMSNRCEGLYKFDGTTWTQMGANLPQDGCAGFVYVDQHNNIWYGDVYSGVWTNKPSLGLEESIAEPITLFPNPVNAILTIGFQDSTNVKIINVLGKIELEKYCTPTSNGMIELDVSFLSSGVYFINLGGKVKKFIKE